MSPKSSKSNKPFRNESNFSYIFFNFAPNFAAKPEVESKFRFHHYTQHRNPIALPKKKVFTPPLSVISYYYIQSLLSPTML